MSAEMLDLYPEKDPKRSRAARRINAFVDMETSGAILMAIATVISFVIANTAFNEGFHHFLAAPITFGVGSISGTISIEMLINDVLMAIFFLVVGAEIKHEILVGELADFRKATLPILAAVGGMVVPAAIYLALNILPGESYPHGWGVAVATDIAFALGVLALIGSKVPLGLKVFLTALAIADDLGAILVIALFYGQSPSWLWIGLTAAIVMVMLLCNRLKVSSIGVYLGLGALLIFTCFNAGIHPTIAGVITAFMLPSYSRIHPVAFSRWAKGRIETIEETYSNEELIIKNEELGDAAHELRLTSKHIIAPLTRIESIFEKPATYVILPLFALANAGVRLVGVDPATIFSDHAAWGVFFGLLVGKPLGIMLMSFVAVKTGLSQLPTGVTWKTMLGAGMLAGIGFTMAIFVANLAFAGHPEVVDAVKASTVAASICAGLLGFAYLKFVTRNSSAEE